MSENNTGNMILVILTLGLALLAISYESVLCGIGAIIAYLNIEINE